MTRKTNSSVPDPLGQEGEERVNRLLQKTQYDPELGKQVARDAQRVVAGDLSEAEFHQKYHKAYLNEFGADKRQIKSAGDLRDTSGGYPGITSGEPDSKPTANQSVSRRSFLKLTGGAAALVVGSSLLGNMMSSISASTGEENGVVEQFEPGLVQMGMVIDLERCTGCLACVDACHRENNTSPGVHWMYVFAYDDENKDDANFLVRTCQHCSNPPCVKVCPVMARHKREKDGLVLTDYNLCIGCRYCQVACPYGANYFQWGEPRPEAGYLNDRHDYNGRKVNGNPPEKGIMGKCIFCPSRQDSKWKKGTTACQLGCPHDALHFGDMNDPNSTPNRYLEERRKEQGGNISTFRLLENLGTRPNILFIGHQPSIHAEQVDGPTTYESWGFVDDRRTVLEGPKPWFMRILGGQ